MQRRPVGEGWGDAGCCWYSGQQRGLLDGVEVAGSQGHHNDVQVVGLAGVEALVRELRSGNGHLAILFMSCCWLTPRC